VPAAPKLIEATRQACAVSCLSSARITGSRIALIRIGESLPAQGSPSINIDRSTEPSP
jgi:hypothetical protein